MTNLVKKQLYKGIDCPTIFAKSFTTGYNIADIPFCLRKNEIAKLDPSNMPFPIEVSEDSLLDIDKFYFMFSSLLKANKDILKHLNLIMNATLRYCDLLADCIIIRHNRVMLIEFCYDLTSNNNLDIKEQQVTFVMHKLENTLKKYLPIDTVVKSYLFPIRKGDNVFEIERLAKTIDDFYTKTTNKELIKLIK